MIISLVQIYNLFINKRIPSYRYSQKTLLEAVSKAMLDTTASNKEFLTFNTFSKGDLLYALA